MLERAGFHPETRSVESHPRPLVPREVVLRTLADNKTNLLYLRNDHECPPEESGELEVLPEETPVQIHEVEHPAVGLLINEVSTLIRIADETSDDRLWEFEQRKWQRILEITRQVDNLTGEPYDHWDELQEFE